MPKPKQNAIICPNCRKLITKAESNCPHCGIFAPGSVWRKYLLAGIFYRPDRLVWLLIYTNVTMFIITLLLNTSIPKLSLNPFSLLSPETKNLMRLGATGTIPIDRMHRWWTLLSANYLHGGVLHLFFNMVAFKQLSFLINREFGTYRMFNIYTISGMGGFFFSYLAGVPMTIGASAAVCGLMGAGIYYGKSRGGLYGRIVFRQIGGWALGIFIFGLFVPGINNWAHGGGLLTGAMAGYVMGYHEIKGVRMPHIILAWVCLILTIVVLSWAIYMGVFYRYLQ